MNTQKGAKKGSRGFSSEISLYTKVLLQVRASQFLYRREQAARRMRGRLRAVASEQVKLMHREGEECLSEAAKSATYVANPDQQSHCYRVIASAWALRKDKKTARQFFARMDLVEGMSNSIIRNNLRARQRWGF